MDRSGRNMARLPLEVILEISSYLYPETLIRCAAVCRAWYAVFIHTISDMDGRRLIDNMRHWRWDSVELIACRLSDLAVLFMQNMGCHPATHVAIRRMCYPNWQNLVRFAFIDQLNGLEHLSVIDPDSLPISLMYSVFSDSRRLRHFTILVEDQPAPYTFYGNREPHIVFSWHQRNVSTFLTHFTISLSQSRRDAAARLELLVEEIVHVSPFLVHLDVNFARVLHRTFLSHYLASPSRHLQACLFTPLDTREYLINNWDNRQQGGGVVLGYSLPDTLYTLKSWTILLRHYARTLTRLYLEGRRVWEGLDLLEFPSLEELVLRIKSITEDEDNSMDEYSSDDESMVDDMMEISDDSATFTPDRILAEFLKKSPQLHTLIIRSEQKSLLELQHLAITDHVLDTLSSHCRKLDYLCISGGSLGRFSSDGLYRFARDSGRRLKVIELDCATRDQGFMTQHIDLGNLILMAIHLRYFELRHVCTPQLRCRLYGQCASIFSARPRCRFFEKSSKDNRLHVWPFTPRIPLEHLFVSSSAARFLYQ